MCYLNVITGSTARSGVLVTQVAFLSIFHHYDSVCSKGFFFFNESDQTLMHKLVKVKQLSRFFCRWKNLTLLS